MSKRRSPKSAPALLDSAALFAVLADKTRLRLVTRLCDQGPASITRLAIGFDITRQAVTKHLRVMQRSGLVRSTRHGRERVWQIDRHRLRDVGHYLDLISKQWDDALDRLQKFVEK